MQADTYTRVYARIKSEIQKVMRCEHFRIFGEAFRDLKFNTLIKSKQWRERAFRDDPLIIMLLHWIQWICLFSFIFINAWQSIVRYKNKFSKLNLTIKANHFYYVWVCVFDFDLLKFLSIIRFSINMPNVSSSSFVVICSQWKCSFAENQNNSLFFLVTTLERKRRKAVATATIITFSWVIKLSNKNT